MRRVLVAEDDAAHRDLMPRLLAFEGYFVTEARDALALLEAVRVQVRDLHASFLPKPFALENLRRIANRLVYSHQRETADAG